MATNYKAVADRELIATIEIDDKLMQSKFVYIKNVVKDFCDKRGLSNTQYEREYNGGIWTISIFQNTTVSYVEIEK